MFDIGWSEMALILLVALVVIGPRDLPRVARMMGRWVAKGRAMAREFQTALEDMAREAELDKVKSEIEKAGRTNLGKAVENTIDPTGELGKAFDPTAASKARATKAVGVKPAASPATNGPAANGGAEPEPAQVVPESKPAAPEAKPESKAPRSKTRSKTPKSKPPEAKTEAKTEAISGEPR